MRIVTVKMTMAMVTILVKGAIAIPPPDAFAVIDVCSLHVRVHDPIKARKE